MSDKFYSAQASLDLLRVQLRQQQERMAGEGGAGAGAGGASEGDAGADGLQPSQSGSIVSSTSEVLKAYVAKIAELEKDVSGQVIIHINTH